MLIITVINIIIITTPTTTTATTTTTTIIIVISSIDLMTIRDLREELEEVFAKWQEALAAPPPRGVPRRQRF